MKSVPLESPWSKPLYREITVPLLEQQRKWLFPCCSTDASPVFFSRTRGWPEHHREMYNSSFERKLNLLVSFLSDQKYWRATRTPSLPEGPLPPKSSNHNFEIVILFNIVQRSNIFGFGDDTTLHSPWRKGCTLYRYRAYLYHAYRYERIVIGRIGIACV